MKKISVIVPMYNEEENVKKFYNETQTVLQKIQDKYDYEMIFIDDGSKDKTLELLKEISKTDNKINIISFSRNFGKESGIHAGLAKSTGDIVVLLDGDLQHDPQLIPEMLKYIEEGYDTVTTIRNRKGESKIKSLLSRMFYVVMPKTDNVKLQQGAQDYRMMTRQVVDAILEMDEYNRFSKGLFEWVGFKTKYIETNNRTRNAGTTKWNYSKLFHYAIEGITSFSIKPLKIATIIGAIISIISLILAVQIVMQTLIEGKDVPGYASTITAVLFIGGIQLITIGILSEYIGKIYLEIKHRPKYIIKENISGENTKNNYCERNKNDEKDN